MNSLILRTASRFLMTLLLVFSLFLLMRGHNEPGGGFVGGLVAASAFSLYTLAYGADMARRLLRIEPRQLIGVGLFTAALSGVPALLLGQPFLTGQWGEIHVPGFHTLPIGTPLLFDVGVYLVVLGVTLMIILSLAEE